MEQLEIKDVITKDERGFYVAKIDDLVLKLNDTSIQEYYDVDKIELLVNGIGVYSYEQVCRNYEKYSAKQKSRENAKKFFDALRNRK